MSACAGELELILGWENPTWRGEHGSFSVFLPGENPLEEELQWARVHGVAKWIQLRQLLPSLLQAKKKKKKKDNILMRGRTNAISKRLFNTVTSDLEKESLAKHCCLLAEFTNC